MIKAIMKRKGITQENLSFELGVDRKALLNYLNQDRPSVAHVIGICVALKVPYFISMEILGAAGIKLRSTEQDFLYRQFLLNAENLTVSRCEDILKQHNENRCSEESSGKGDRGTVKSISVFLFSRGYQIGPHRHHVRFRQQVRCRVCGYRHTPF